ncbi:MAG: hypothetical protein FWF51_11055 [Chitinivibrionia bacterium]|nr:hypothetical protein [Chitinivibrionia bacterium]
MKTFAFGTIILAIAASMAFGQGSTKNQLDSCNVRLGDAQTSIRNLNNEVKSLKEEVAKSRNVATERDRAVAKVSELEKKNKEMSDNVALIQSKAANLETLAAENTRLATENMELRNRATTAVAAPMPSGFSYPISGVVENKSVQGNVIAVDFLFVNNGSRMISNFDCVLKFYYQEREIYKITLPNVRNQASSSPIGRNESIRFRAGLPVTDQNLVNVPVAQLDLIVEVTKIH